MKKINSSEKPNIENLLDKYIDTLGYLRDRWQDEREYEDFSDYKKRVEEIFGEFGFTGITLSKGFVIKCKNCEGTSSWEIKIQARGVKVAEFQTASSNQL